MLIIPSWYVNTYNLLSEINLIIRLLKKNDITYSLDERGAYSLLAHGYMIEDLTPFSEIKRLKAGCFIKIDNNTDCEVTGLKLNKGFGNVVLTYWSSILIKNYFYSTEWLDNTSNLNEIK